ncbi:MAG: type II toxin-antitoxin system VapC family toxin [Candidatus Omnitrophota bacterium]|nr:type II toxin-antitoxin system VapC family toxin [Candidatus Omnitrophota bacterium]
MWYTLKIMKKISLYLDTSIYNFAISENNPEEREATLKLLEGIKEGKYEAFISELVSAEIDKAPQEIAVKLRSVIKGIDPEELAINEEVKGLADKYIAQQIIPVKYANDAIHIAVASVNNIDVIVSWNFEHMVKLKTKRGIVGVNALLGYKPVEILTPLEVVDNV